MSKSNKDNKKNGPSNPTDAVPNFLYREPRRITQTKEMKAESRCDCEFCSCEKTCIIAFDRLDSLESNMIQRMEHIGLFASNVIEMHNRILGASLPPGFSGKWEMNE